MIFFKKIKYLTVNFFLLIIVTLVFFIILEILTRFSIHYISKDKDIYFYGFNKKIDIQIFDLGDLKINIINNEKKIDNISEKKIKNEDKITWAFGGSTSDVSCINENSTSWPNELNKFEKLDVVTFAKTGRNTDFAIKILESELQKKNVITPKIILWANYVNEASVLFYGLDLNKDKIKVDQKTNYKKNKFFLLIQRIDLTFYNNFVSFYFFKEVSHRLIFYKFPKFPQKILDDYNIAIKNYNLNTFKAIKLAKKINSDFYIVTLFTKDDFIQKKNEFGEKYFFPNIINILNNFSGVKWIDTRKEVDNLNNDFNEIFCDSMHFTTSGHEIVAKIIQKEISKN